MLFCAQKRYTKAFRRAVVIATAFAFITILAASVNANPVVPIAKPAPGNRLKFDTRLFVPESELQNGQIGYGLTVFHGQKIERFGVEILGVISKVNNGKDLILIKVISGPSVTRQANIAEGMSGSPVYIGKRMVGAIAYGFAFAREPIGLVTPIGDMLDAWDPDLPAKPMTAIQATPLPASSNGVAVSNSLLSAYLGATAIKGGLGDATASTTFEPMMTPVMVSGMSQTGISRLTQVLAPYGLQPVAGGGGGSSGKPTAKDLATLVPGGAVGVSLVQGDIDMTAIGTLTYRDGNRVIAFGHPFTGIGPIDAALTTATITDLFPSLQNSMKLGSPDVTVGRIFQDRPFSVGGLIGSMPQMIPVDVSINDLSDKRTQTYHARVINHPLLSGKLIGGVVDQAILETHGTPGDAIATVKFDVDAEQVGHIIRSNVYYDPLSINDTAISDLDNLLALLSANPFYPLAVKSVKFSVTIESKHDTAEIDHITVPKVTYQPGDTVNVGIVLKPYKQDPVLETIPLTIPSSTPDGTLTLQVRGGMVTLSDILSGHSSTSTTTAVVNVDQLLRKFNDEPKNNELVASLLLSSTALDIQGEKMSLLPPTESAVMRGQHSSGLHLERDEVKSIKTMPWVLSGSQVLTITVARKNPLDTATPAPATVPTSTDTTTSASAGADTSAMTASALAPVPVVSSSGALDANPEAAQITPSALGNGETHPEALNSSSPDITSTIATDDISPSFTDIADSSDDSSSDDTDTSSTSVTSIVRAAKKWRQDTAVQFATGTLDNVAVTSVNDLRLAASANIYATSTASYAWALVTDDKGNVYVGTGDDGVVYKTSPTGTMTSFFSTGELEVMALTLDPKTGDLYAGVAPHGDIFRITPDGKGDKIFTAPEKYITALVVDTVGQRLLAATGGGVGKIYAAPLSDPGSMKTLWTSQQTHLLTLAVDSKGNLYAGGAPDGLVYQISPTGQGKILYTTGQPNVSALAVGKNDIVYAGTSPKGAIYKITPTSTGNADVKTLSVQNAGPIYSMATAPDGSVWATSSNTLFSIAPDDTILAHTAATDVQFISVTSSADDAVYAGTSDIAQVYALGGSVPAKGNSAIGTYTSSVHDAKLPSQWGQISWDGAIPPGASLIVQTRTGDVVKPDTTWSDWSAAYATASGEQITSPSARYIQYRVQFKGPTPVPSACASLRSVTIYYLTRNQAPTVKLTSPSGGDVVDGDYTIRWSASDPDKDTMSYDVSYSTDQTVWQLIKETQSKPTSTKSDTSTPPATKSPKAPSAIPAGARTTAIAEAYQAPNIHIVPVTPPPAATAPATPTAPSETSTPSTEPAHVTTTSVKWSTSKVPDGSYWIKVVASDAPSNATDSLTANSVIGPIIVDNTKPTVTLSGSPQIDSQKQVTVAGVATGKYALITGVQYKIDDGDWAGASASNGLFDSTNESFSLTTQPLSSGSHKITVEAVNQAQNSAQTTADVKIP